VVTAAASTVSAANATATFNALASQIVPLSATVTSAAGTINEGTVTFTVRDAGSAVIGAPVTSSTVASGSASANFSLPSGTNAQTLTITAVYNGTANIAPSTDATHTLTVVAAASVTSGANATTTFSASPHNVPLAATVTSANGTVNAGTVTFTVRNAGSVVIGAPVTSGAVSGGAASANYTLPGGTGVQTLTITAVYNGSANFATSTDATHTLTVTPAATTTTPANASANPGPSPQSVPLTATVASAGGTVPTGTVTFMVTTAGNVPVGAPVSGPVVSGTANAIYTLPGGTAPQTLTVTASYGATTNFGASTGAALLTVGCSSLSISPSAAPTVWLGQPFSLPFIATGIGGATVTLTGTPPPGLILSGSTVSGVATSLGRFDITATATSPASSCSTTTTYALRVMRSPTFVTAAGGGSPSVRVFDNRGMLTASLLADDPSFAGGIRVAMADLTSDGVADIITAPGDGAFPIVRVFDGSTGAVIRSFVAYPTPSSGGTYVAAGDVNGDGVPDIITGRDGAAPEVRVFDGKTGVLLSSFLAYGAGVGGVRVAAGDVDADGIAEIITSPPFGSAPEVRIYSAAGVLRTSFMAYAPAFIGGVFVAAGDIDGDGRADIITGADAGGGPHVQAFSGADLHVLRSFFAYDPAFPGGVRVAAGDLDLDGHAEIITAAGPGGGPHVRVFDGVTGAERVGMFAFDPAFSGGVFPAAAPPQSRLAIDLPGPGATVPASFPIAGWVFDGSASGNSGIDAIHVWAAPAAGGAPIFVGWTTDLGTSPRPDVAGLFGGFYSESGFNVPGGPLPPGTYDLYVFAHSARSGTFNTIRVVRIVVTP